MSRFLQLWCKLNTRKIVKTGFVFCVIILVISLMICFSSFLTISYRFPWCFGMFRHFPLVFIQFRRVFLLFPLSASHVSCFRFCAENILEKKVENVERDTEDLGERKYKEIYRKYTTIK